MLLNEAFLIYLKPREPCNASLVTLCNKCTKSVFVRPLSAVANNSYIYRHSVSFPRETEAAARYVFHLVSSFNRLDCKNCVAYFRGRSVASAGVPEPGRAPRSCVAGEVGVCAAREFMCVLLQELRPRMAYYVYSLCLHDLY